MTRVVSFWNIKRNFIFICTKFINRYIKTNFINHFNFKCNFREFLKCFPRDSNGWFPLATLKFKREKTQCELR